MKKLILVLATLSTFSLAHANKNANEDLAYIGIDASQTQLMSKSEMKETQGAWVNWAVGGAIGGAGYAYGAYRGNYPWNTSSFIGNVGTGALIGGTFGALGAAAGGGLSAGANIWRANSFIGNTGVNYIWRC